MISFATVWKSLLDFAKNPQPYTPSESAEEERVPAKQVFPYLLGIDFMLMIFLTTIMGLAGVEEMEHEVEKLLDDPLLLAFMAVVLAPFFEEAIFRLPLGPWLGKYFRVLFWLFTFAFAAVHLTNFSGGIPLYLAPLMVLPQFALGIILGFIRVGWGFWYAVLFHALHNGILVSLATIGQWAMEHTG